jgi:hypothetical protein
MAEWTYCITIPYLVVYGTENINKHCLDNVKKLLNNPTIKHKMNEENLERIVKRYCLIYF